MFRFTKFNSTYMVLILLLSLQSLQAETLKTKSDFIPPPPAEGPLLNYIPEEVSPETGIWISSAGILTGMTLSLLTTRNTMNRALEDPYNPGVQQGVIQTGVCLIGTAVFTVMLDYFLEKRQSSKRATSEE